jgi:hypothetical protein
MAASFLKAGSYEHANASTMFRIARQFVRGPTGRLEFIRHNWFIRGFLDDTTVSGLTAKIQALEAAYAVGGFDIVFMLGAGSESHHKLETADCLNGTVVKSFNWEGQTARGSGVEYVFRRSFSIVVSGDEDPGGQDSDIVFWTESVQRFCDGTAHNVWLESLLGAPEYQTTVLQPKHITLQSGRAIGRTDYPAEADLLWAPPYYISKPGNVGHTHPSYIGLNDMRNFGTNWRYTYESDVALVGDPTLFTP